MLVFKTSAISRSAIPPRERGPRSAQVIVYSPQILNGFLPEEPRIRRQKALKVIAVCCGFAAALLIPLSVAHAANEDIPAPSPGTPEVAVSTGGVLEAGHAY